RRIGSGARSGGGREGGRTGRFNARGRGAKVVASFAPQGADGGWQRDSAGRFRARRVVVKARVVRLNPQGKGSRGPKMRGTMSRAVDAHLRYLERMVLRMTASGARPIRRSRTRLTVRPLWSAGGKMDSSFGSSS